MFRTAILVLGCCVISGCQGPSGTQPATKEPNTVAAPETNVPQRRLPGSMRNNPAAIKSGPAQSAPTTDEAVTSEPQGKAIFRTAQEVIDKLKLPVYPKSAVDPETVTKSVLNEQGEYRLNVVLRSGDPVPKVAKFYEEAIGSTKSEKPNGFDIMGRTQTGAFILMSVTREGDQTVVRARGIVTEPPTGPS